MKRRLFLYNIALVLGALVWMWGVTGLSMHWVTRSYVERAVPAVPSTTVQVREVLDDLTPGTSWQELDQTLDTLGYRLRVSVGERVVYSSLEPAQVQLLEARQTDFTGQGQASSFYVQDRDLLVLGDSVGTCTVSAVTYSGGPMVLGAQRPQLEGVMLTLLFSGLSAIAVILLLTMFLSRYTVRQIMRPVNALTDAARRIEQGDYTQTVDYAGSDEFAAVCVAFDHMQQHLLREQEKNAAYEQARTDLVAGISHDLRTPLTSVKGYIKGLLDGVANTPEKQAQYLDVAYRKACDMDVLLQRLFYFSKVDTGKLPMFPERVDLGEFVKSFVSNARVELEPKGVKLHLRGVPALHPVRIDTEQLYRVLNNLTENALRYAGREDVELTLTVWRERDMECIRFADNGQGVPEEQLAHLFEQFWRGDQARGSKHGEGSGLGLHIVQHIIRAHNGTITVKNQNGLVFDIAIPCDMGEAAPDDQTVYQ